MQRPFVKVCGNKFPDNLKDVCAVTPDYLGFILHPDSPRGVSVKECIKLLSLVPESIKTAGVFVSTQLDGIRKIQEEASFDAIQLHGDQDVNFISVLKKTVSAEIVKVFSVDSTFDFESCRAYEGLVDYFLFDTKGVRKGGNGVPFDWAILSKYRSNVPFILAGGITGFHATALKNLLLQIPQLCGFDINSGFETEPGRKNFQSIASFIGEVK